MSQHYVPPARVILSADAPRWPSRFLKRIIERDGLIVPILVHQGARRGQFVAADHRQSERVMACSELGFETVLIETEWDEDDL